MIADAGSFATPLFASTGAGSDVGRTAMAATVADEMKQLASAGTW